MKEKQAVQNNFESLTRSKELNSFARANELSSQEHSGKLKPILRKATSLVILVLFALGTAYYIWDNLPIFVDSVKRLSILIIVIYALLSGSILYVDGLTLRLFFKPFGIDLKHFFLLSCVVSFINQVTPFRGGVGFKAWYMKKVYDFSYLNSAVITFGEYILIFLIISAMALVNMAWLYYSQGIFNFWMILIFASLFLGCLVSILLRGVRVSDQNRVSQTFNNILINWEMLVSHPGQIFWMSVYTIISIGISSLMFIIMSKGIDYPLPFNIAFQLALLSYLTFFINITPGSIGVLEFVCLLGGVGLGLNSQGLILLLLVMRVVRSASILLYGFISKPILLHTMKRSKAADFQ